jgi:hypothetical protein
MRDARSDMDSVVVSVVMLYIVSLFIVFVNSFTKIS